MYVYSSFKCVPKYLEVILNRYTTNMSNGDLEQCSNKKLLHGGMQAEAIWKSSLRVSITFSEVVTAASKSI